MTKAMRRTDAIIEDLINAAEERLAAGTLVDIRAVQQEITAHQELARLRVRRAERLAAKDYLQVNEVNAQIQHWLRFVSEDVDEKVAEAPEKNATTLVAPPAPDIAGTPA